MQLDSEIKTLKGHEDCCLQTPYQSPASGNGHELRLADNGCGSTASENGSWKPQSSHLLPAEGSAKPTAKDQARYYAIAMGSLRESQAAVEMIGTEADQLRVLSNKLGGSLHCLIEATRGRR
jgi:hypothetical protein